jgi:ubiquitin-protein ligase
MSTLFYKRLHKEIQLYQKDNFSFSNLILKPTDNLSVWYAVIHDLKDTEYAGGVYLMKILVPEKYPLSPPDFNFLTPSGRFDINKKLCTSFSGYHKDLYSASWNISAMCCGFISFMTDDASKSESQGIGGIISTTEYKKQIAKESRNYIKNNKVVFDIFEKHFKEYYEILGLN